jgi:hypothetical protein
MRTPKPRPCRHRTGLRNRDRGGQSTYCVLSKGRTADYYGAWMNGRRTTPERIAR